MNHTEYRTAEVRQCIPVLWHNQGLRRVYPQTTSSPLLVALSLAVACGFPALACNADVNLVVLVPDSATATLGEIVSFQLLAARTRATGTENPEPAVSPSLDGLTLTDLEPGVWNFTITGTDPDGFTKLRSETRGVRVRDGRPTAITALLAPVESFTVIPDSSDAGTAVSALVNMTATPFNDEDGLAFVLIAGGETSGVKSRRAWLFRTDRMQFEAVGDMSCPRSGHSAAAVQLWPGHEGVLVAGGGPAKCTGSLAGHSAGEVIESFDLATRSFGAGAVELTDGDAEDAPSSAIVFPAGETAERTAKLVSVDSIHSILLKSLAVESESLRTLPIPIDPAGRRLMPVGTGFALVGRRSENLTVMHIPPDESEIGGPFDISGDFAPGLTFASGRAEGGILLSSAARVALFRRLFSDKYLVIHGTLPEDRSGHEAVWLDDRDQGTDEHRTLFIGGRGHGSHQFADVTLTCWGCGVITHQGPEHIARQPGFAAVALPNGSALVLGGSAPAELFNPMGDWEATTGGFAEAPIPDSMHVAVIVDASEESETLRALIERNLADLVPRAGSQDDGNVVGFLSTSYPTRIASHPCPDTPPGFITDSCGETGQEPWLPLASLPAPPDITDFNLSEAARCRLDATGDSCTVVQPLHALETALSEAQDRAGSLLVLIFATEDDCSEDPDQTAQPNCETDVGLLEPARVAARVLAAERDDLRISVVLFHEGITPPRRLFELIDTLEDRGRAFSLYEMAGELAQGWTRSQAQRGACVVWPVRRYRSHRDMSCRVFAQLRGVETEEGNAPEYSTLIPDDHWLLSYEDARCRSNRRYASDPEQRDAVGAIRLRPDLLVESLSHPLAGGEELSLADFSFLCWPNAEAESEQ